MLRNVAGRMADLGITLETEQSAVDLVSRKGFDPIYGARPLRRVIQSDVEDLVAEEILEGRITSGDTVLVSARDGKITAEKK